MSMKLPELLDGHSMTRRGVIRPLSMSQTWKEEGQSTATITMPPEADEIEVGSWIRVYSPNGMNAVMYVKTEKTDYVTGIRTYNLEHCFQLLQEMVIFGEYGPEDMGGSETEVGSRTALTFLLNHQTETLFTLGTTALSDTEGWSFRNTNIHAGIMDIMEAIEDCTLEFSMSSLPWTLKLKAYPTDETIEMRMNRNLSTMSVSVDKSKMYTRAYPVGKDDLHITGDYIDRHTDRYGIIERVITEGSISSKSLLRKWAVKQLKKNSVPYVSVNISGMELSASTGEDLDKLLLGKICRVPLPKYNDVVTERITEISWKNVMLSEIDCTVTMANERKTVQGVLNQITSGGGAGSQKSFHSSGCKLHEHDEEIKDHWTAIQRNDYYIRLEAYERVNGDNYNYSYIEQTASYIRAEVGETANGLYSRIEQTASYIRAEVANTANGLYSRIEQTASYIRSEVADTAASIRSEVAQTASSWEAKIEGVVGPDGKVTAASIGVAINENGSNAFINADHVHITGDTLLSGHLTVDNGTLKVLTALAIGNTTGNIVTINNGTVQAPNLQVNSGGNLTLVGSQTGEYYQLNASNIQNFIKNAEVDGNTLKLYKMTDSSTPSITFSKATTLGGAWSGDLPAKILTVTATPQGNTYEVRWGGSYADGRKNLEVASNGTPSVTTVSSVKMISVPIKVQSLTGAQSQPETVYETSVTVSKATLLESARATANGYLSLSSDKIGFSSVYVDVPLKVVYDPSYYVEDLHETYKVVKPTTSTSGFDFLRIWPRNNGLSNGARTIDVFCGSTPVEQLTITDYSDGQDSMGVEIRDNDGTKQIHVAESSTKGYAITRTLGSVGSGGSRTITVKAGSTTLYTDTISDYADGRDSMGVEIRDNDGTKQIHVAESSTKGYAITRNLGSVSNGSRTITVSAGSTQLYADTITDYSDGFDAGNANRASQITGFMTTSDTATGHLSAGQKYKFQSQYKKYDGTWANGGTVVVDTPANNPGTVTVTFQSAVGSHEIRAGRSSDPIEVYSKLDGTTKVTTNLRMTNTTYIDSNGDELYCVDLHVGTGTSGTRIGRISTQSRYNAGRNSVKLQTKDVTITSGTTLTPDSGYSGFSSVTIRQGRSSSITLSRGTKIADNVYTYSVTLSNNVTGNASTFVVYY